MTLRPIAAAVAVIAAAAFAASCARADYIEITPDIATLKQKNNSVWLIAHVKSQNGREYPQVTVSWSVKDPSVATIDETGKLTPLKSGRTEAVASYGDVKASIPVEVLFAEKMKVEPASLELVQDGDPVDLNVTVYDYTGRPLKDRTPTFRSLDTKVVTMGSNAVHPGDPGTTQIEVRVDELKQLVDVTVKKRK
ncbi:MAG: Ig-like domain-containing protein [Myxococcaceae bacterium]|nr:Ig-like domain-containing protein [Myxococcaceae bacterium]